MNISLKGAYSKNGNSYIYKFNRIIPERAGSIVEVREKNLTLKTNILGFDKLYYAIDKDTFIISNRLQDFYNYPVDENLWPFQCIVGYVPYPFTIFQNVRKALPGVEMDFTYDRNSGWSCKYKADHLQEISNSCKSYDVNTFKRTFLSMIDIPGKFDRNIIASFSGGFDSLLLTNVFKNNIIGIMHYEQEHGEAERFRETFRHLLPDVPWYVYNGNDTIDKRDVESYFCSIDEPCFDIAGLAEFVMVKKFLAASHITKPLYILNGQNADAIFANGRKYFKEHLCDIVLLSNRCGLNLRKKIKMNGIYGKTVDYLKSTKTRFEDVYTKHYELGDYYKAEIDNVFEIYDGSINTNRSNFLSFLVAVLLYSNRDLEKFKPVISNCDISYFLPFCDFNILKFALSISPKYKVSYKLGKKILRKSFNEIDNAPYSSRSFIPNAIWKSVSQDEEYSDYVRFYANKWRSYRKELS